MQNRNLKSTGQERVVQRSEAISFALVYVVKKLECCCEAWRRLNVVMRSALGQGDGSIATATFASAWKVAEESIVWWCAS
jgi:hypothetical protein